MRNYTGTVIKLLNSKIKEDRDVGYEIFVQYATKADLRQIEREFKEFGLYYIGGRIEQKTHTLCIPVLTKEQFEQLKKRLKMNYTATRHRNIYKMGRKYRVRKCMNGRKMSKVCTTIKECKDWLAKLN